MGSEEIRRLLTALLESSGAAWEQADGWICFRLSKDGAVWDMACRCLTGRMLAYGRLPLRAAGLSRRGAFAAGAASGLVELAGAALAGALAARIAPALPWLLGAAAGTMAFTVARQLAPAAAGEGRRGAAGAALGFGAMLALRALLG